MTDQFLADRVAVLEGELETRRQFGCYPRLYGPMAVLSVGLSFLPLLGDVIVRDDGGTTTWRYGTLWEMAARGSGSPAALGAVILVSFVVLLVVATVRVRSKALPVAIAVHAVVLAVLLLTKPGTAEPTPSLTDAGVADVALLLVIAATAAVHAVHLHSWQTRLTHSVVSSPRQQPDARDGAERDGGES